MSKKFMDVDGETYEVLKFGAGGRPMIELATDHGQSFSFYAEDVSEIIALIEGAAK